MDIRFDGPDEDAVETPATPEETPAVEEEEETVQCPFRLKAQTILNRYKCLGFFIDKDSIQ